MRCEKGCAKRSRASSARDLRDAALVLDVVVELEVVERPRVEARSARARRSRRRSRVPCERRQERAREAVEKRLAARASGRRSGGPPRRGPGVCSSTPPRGDVDRAEAWPPASSSRRSPSAVDGAARVDLHVEAAHDVGREPRVRDGESPRDPALAVERDGAAVVGEDRRAPGRSRWRARRRPDPAAPSWTPRSESDTGPPSSETDGVARLEGAWREPRAACSRRAGRSRSAARSRTASASSASGPGPRVNGDPAREHGRVIFQVSASTPTSAPSRTRSASKERRGRPASVAKAVQVGHGRRRARTRRAAVLGAATGVGGAGRRPSDALAVPVAWSDRPRSRAMARSARAPRPADRADRPRLHPQPTTSTRNCRVRARSARSHRRPVAPSQTCRDPVDASSRVGGAPVVFAPSRRPGRRRDRRAPVPSPAARRSAPSPARATRSNSSRSRSSGPARLDRARRGARLARRRSRSRGRLGPRRLARRHARHPLRSDDALREGATANQPGRTRSTSRSTCRRAACRAPRRANDRPKATRAATPQASAHTPRRATAARRLRRGSHRRSARVTRDVPCRHPGERAAQDKEKEPARRGLLSFLGKNPGGVLLSHTASRAVPSAPRSLTSEFGMGSGVASSRSPPEICGSHRPSALHVNDLRGKRDSRNPNPARESQMFALET